MLPPYLGPLALFLIVAAFWRGLLYNDIDERQSFFLFLLIGACLFVLGATFGQWVTLLAVAR